MIFDKLLLFTAITGSVAALLNVAGANLYDIRQVSRRRQQLLHPHARQYRKRPLVSVIVATQNAEKTIAACLDSLGKSSYRKLEIILADDASTDNTRQIVRQFIASHPKKQVRLYAKRRQSRRPEVLTNAYRQYAHGELVFLLDSAYAVDKRAIAKAVDRFNGEPSIDVLSVNYKVQRGLQTAGLFQEFNLLLRNRAKKASSAFQADYLIDHVSAAVYSSNIFTKLARAGLPESPLLQLGDKSVCMGYASDVVVYGQALSFYGLVKQSYRLNLRRLALLLAARRVFFTSNLNYTRLLAWFKLPLVALLGLTGLALPVLLTYFTYLATSLHQPAFLVASWSVLAIFLLLAIWEDEQLKLREKLKYIALMPVTYGWFYLMSLVQYSVLLTSFRVRAVKDYY